MLRTLVPAAALIAFGTTAALADDITCKVDEVDDVSNVITCGNTAFKYSENVVGLKLDEIHEGDVLNIAYEYEKGGVNTPREITNAEQ